MSIGDKGICVRILDKEFRVACSYKQEQALRDAAQHLDKQMRKIRQNGKIVSTERVAMMAALNIANDLLTMKNSPFDPGAEFNDRLTELNDKMDLALTESALWLEQRDIERDRVSNSDSQNLNFVEMSD